MEYTWITTAREIFTSKIEYKGGDVTYQGRTASNDYYAVQMREFSTCIVLSDHGDKHRMNFYFDGYLRSDEALMIAEDLFIICQSALRMSIGHNGKINKADMIERIYAQWGENMNRITYDDMAKSSTKEIYCAA